MKLFVYKENVFAELTALNNTNVCNSRNTKHQTLPLYTVSKKKIIAFKNGLLSFKDFCKLPALLKSSCSFLIAVLRCLMAMNDISPCTVLTRFLCYCLKIQDGRYFSKVNTIRAIFLSLSLFLCLLKLSVAKPLSRDSSFPAVSQVDFTYGITL